MFEYLSVLNEKENLSYAMILLVGFLASFHCVGMCGGLVIAYSADSLNRKQDALSAHFQYNFGRLISYTIIGTILGAIGSFFAINNTFTGVITIGASLFMIIMGLSLIVKINWLEKIKPRMPFFIARFIYSNKIQAPLLLGLFTGLMPCGPLQAMQMYALSTGSAFQGGFSMAIYALGTIPVMFGFGNIISKLGQEKIKYFMKISGAIVIVLALIMFNRGLTNFGFNFSAIFKQEQKQININDADAQIINMDLDSSGYQPNTLNAKVNVPVKWIINAQEISGCTSSIIIPEYNINQKLSKGENIIVFTPTRTGELKFSCGMQMVWGKFIISE